MIKITSLFLFISCTCIALGADRPNIIYILADDLGYGDLGSYGQKEIETPHIDRLSREGIRFTNHYSGSTVCAPSRASLLTGQHTGHVTVRANGKLKLREDPLDITIARVLKTAGYHTAMIGKSGTGCQTDPGHANRKGFDYFFGFNNHGAAHHYFPPVVFRNSEEVVYPNNHRHHGDTYIHDEFIKEALAYIEDRAKEDQPFFLHYAALIPHASIVAPEEWVAKYRGKVKEAKPVSPGHYAKCDEPKATFAGMVSRLDWEVGEIVRKIEELGLGENTLIIFSSDNGPHSAGGNRTEWFNSNGPFRGQKRDLYEGGVRVPMIARWDGTITPDSETDHVSAFWDVFPTLCELTGSSVPESVDGISFLPTLLGKGEQEQAPYLYWEFYEQGGKRAARMQNWKAVQLEMKKGGGSIQLYNLMDDPSEKEDLAQEYPEVVKQFEQLFDSAHTPSDLVSW